MPVSRSDGISALRRLAPLLLLGAAAPALAAGPVGPPTPLRPPQPQERQQQEQPPHLVLPPAAVPAPVVPPAGGAKPIEVDPLAPIDPDWAGPLTAERGGFPPQLWQGTPRPFIAALLPRLPATNSPALQDLTRRLLLSNAVPPAEAPQGSEPSIAALRIDRLVASGQLDAAQSLLNILPNHGSLEGLERRGVELAFLAGDRQSACDRVGEDVRRFKDLWWTRALTACQAMSGDTAKAALGLDLLHEQKAAKDEAFDSLVETLGGRGGKIERLPDPSPLHVALLGAGKQAMPEEALRTAPPAILRAWAGSEAAPPAQRLAAAERAAAFGALPLDALRAAYEKTEFTAEERASPAAAAAKAKGARRHALFYVAARDQNAPAARAEPLRAMLDGARKEGEFPIIAAVIEPLLLEIPPAKDLA
ncbi:MAG: hypothetical protein JO010_04035, partial [Alphaproteobacteria bacterium]|nr:hypothetical protein [Alphaproteobacteria bacterium]